MLGSDRTAVDALREESLPGGAGFVYRPACLLIGVVHLVHVRMWPTARFRAGT
jgi:hypothetical protein